MRLRAEILRREEQLYLTRLGAYLHDRSPATVERRLSAVNPLEPPFANGSSPGSWQVVLAPQTFWQVLRQRLLNKRTIVLELLALMEMGDRDGSKRQDWRDALEEASRESAQPTGRPDQGLPDTDWHQTAETYKRDRLMHQRTYYDRAAEKHALMDEGWESMTVSILGFAGVLGLLHWKLLGLSHEPGVTHQLVELVALALPPVGAAFVAMRTAFENHHLAQSYREMVRQLDNLIGELEEWLDAGRLDTRAFQRLVMRAETLLSQEIFRWAVIVTPARPKGGP